MELITLKEKLKEVDDINSTLSLELEMTKRQKSPSYIESGMVWKLYPVYNEHLSFRQCSKPNWYAWTNDDQQRLERQKWWTWVAFASSIWEVSFKISQKLIGLA